MSEIKFGTDGWRAVLNEDFNDKNVEYVINAIGKYIFENFGIDKRIIIGYDPRRKADFYAEKSAGILSECGFNVFLSSEIIPTPCLAYNAKLNNACAIMFTASHNPPKYLGIKFIPDYAGPATDEITKKIVNNLKIPFKTGKKPGKYEKISFKYDYFKRLEHLIDFEKIRNASLKIVYDGLFGAGVGFFDEILKREKINFEGINLNYDSNFGGKMPDPKPQYLTKLIEIIKSKKDTIGLSNDGDADRFGVINENAEFINPNEIIAILLKHLIKNKKFKGKLAKTVGSSSMLDIIAKKYDTEVIETPVGFKFIGEAMRKNPIIIGGEESGGLSILGHIPEKDGILANLLILEAIAYEKKSLVELQEELKKEIGKEFFNERLDLKLSDKVEQKRVMQKIEKEMKNVKKIDKKDGIKFYLKDNLTWVLVRPSGTEPILRIYFESTSKKDIENLKNKIALI